MSEITHKYGWDFRWSPAPNASCRVTIKDFTDPGEAAQRFAEVLNEMGYEEPKLHQWWRWGAARIPHDVAVRLRALRTTGK